jgi:hypothetical protein
LSKDVALAQIDALKAPLRPFLLAAQTASLSARHVVFNPPAAGGACLTPNFFRKPGVISGGEDGFNETFQLSVEATHLIDRIG